MGSSVSIIIPAYNEEGNIEGALQSVTDALKGVIDDYEIIIIDDGSRDQTAAIAKAQSQKNPRVKVVSNEKNEGYGYSFRRGVGLAVKTYVTVFPGDNDMSSDSLRNLIQARTLADCVSTHPVKGHRRSLFRRTLSRTFVCMMNILFGLNLKYYNGAFICKTALLQATPIKSNGLAVLAESLIRLIKAGCSFQSIPFEHTGRKSDKSKAFSRKSIAAVLATVLILIQDIYFDPKKSAQNKNTVYASNRS